MDSSSLTLAKCPKRDELAEFATGNLPARPLQRIARHVESCSECQQALTDIDETGDPMLTALRQANRSPPASDPVPTELLTAARSMFGTSGDAPVLAAPQRLGKFDIIEELGAGSFGQVYRARDTELSRIVAIKMLRAGRFAGREEVDRFLREARSAAQLQHPGLVALYETGQSDDGQIYLVEEFIEGETLAARIGHGRVEPRQAADLVAAVAEALDYAHRRGVIHRDVKPSNILIDPAGRPHLMDFGLAKRDTDESSMTVEGQLVGTPAYISPEQARGEARDVDGRTDVYSLGVVLYELLAGDRPFRGNRQMLIMQVLHDEPRPPRQLNHRAPRDLETICLKAMAKTPARRYATAGEFAADLRRYLSGEPILARPIGRAERLLRWCRHNPVPVGLLLAVTLSSIFGMWELSRLSESLVRTSAIESAAQQSEILNEVNNFYSSEVVDRLQGKRVEITHDYTRRPGAIPLPATALIELSKHISERSHSGIIVRLYSDYPFRSRKDGGPKDAFEREALDRLSENHAKPFYRFEDFQGRPVLRYATAQRMQQTCVQCHNTHTDSVKKDWREGQVGGVLEIIRPLDRDEERARIGMRRTLIIMAVISGSMLSLSAVVLLLSQRRRASPAA